MQFLPHAVSTAIRTKVPTLVTLKTARGTWKLFVDLDVAERKVAFTHGWKQFVENHDIKVGYFTVFERQQGFLFDVTVYGYNLRSINYDVLQTDPGKDNNYTRNSLLITTIYILIRYVGVIFKWVFVFWAVTVDGVGNFSIRIKRYHKKKGTVVVCSFLWI